MRLHRLHVENFKSISSRTLTLPDSGLVIAEGLNEVGKTSMVEALDLLLDSRLKAGSKATRVRQAQPYGTDLPVVVEAEMTVGGVRLRHSKQFLCQPQARLEFLSGPRSGQILTGEEATDAMATIWDGTDKTLWQALRLMQAGSLEAFSLRSSTALTTALDRAVCHQSTDDDATPDVGSATGADRDGESLLAAVQHEYEQYWTPTGKPGKALKAATEELDALQTEYLGAQQKVAEVDSVVADLEATREDLEAQQKVVGGLRVQADRDAADLAALEAVERAATEAARAEKDARRDLDGAVRAREGRSAAVQELAEARQQEQAAGAAAAEALTTVDQVEAEYAEADRVWRAADDQVRRRRTAWEEARRRAAALRDRARLDRLDQLISRLSTLQSELRKAEGQVASNPASSAAITSADTAEKTLTEARIRLDTASPRMTLTRLSEQAPQLTVDGVLLAAPEAGSGSKVPASEDHRAAQDQRIDRAIDRSTTVEIDQAWRITVTPASDVDDLVQRVQDAEAALAKALEPIGAASVEQARDLLDKRRRDQAAVKDLRKRLSRELAEAGTEVGSDLGEEVTLAHIMELRDQIVAASAPADTEDLPQSLSRADEQVAATESELEASELEEKTARSARDTVSERRGQAKASASGAESTLRAVHELVDRLESRLADSRRQISDEELAENARVATQTHQDAADHLGRATQELADHAPDEVREAAEGSARRLTRATERLAQAKSHRAELTGQLRGLDREGRQDICDELAGRLHRARIETTALTRRAEAARLLHDTLVRHRDEEHRRYREPFTREIERLGRAVFGGDLAVHVDDSLTVTQRLLNGAWLDWDQLSTGAKEQLGLVVRLATAQLVDPADGVPVILDDALVYSDRVRTARVLKEVATGSRSNQVIVLTSAPERYDGLDAVHVPFR